MAEKAGKRKNNRGQELQDAAATLFATQGYEKTTIREIAKAVNMLPGSAYYHFSSKQELLLAIYREGVARVCKKVDEAIARETDPWKRLAAGLGAHLSAILDEQNYPRVLISVVPSQVPEIAEELTEQRDRYEIRFTRLLDEIDLPEKADRRLLRLFLMGAVNWAEVWYDPGKSTPEDIAGAFIAFLTHPLKVG